MKRMKKISAFLLVLLMSIGLMAVSVSAETMSQDGLQITLTADKESYSQTDPVTATLTVKNTNNFAVTNVSLETMIPEGYKLDGNSEATAKIDSLNAGESYELTVTYIPEKTAAGSSGSGSDNSAPDINSSLKTGDNMQFIIWAVLLICAVIVIIGGAVRNRKKGKRCLSLLLVVTLTGTSAFSFSGKTYAAEIQTKSLNIETSVKVGDSDLKLAGTVNYDYDADADYNTNTHSVAFNLLFEEIVEDISPYEPQTVADGSTAVRPSDPHPVLGEFGGWYTSSDYSEEFDFNKPITADTVIYAKWEFDTTDSDGDGVYDSIEDYLGLDPDNPDSDNDGLDDYDELIIGTDPLTEDTDGNGVSDYDEDADNDGLSNGYEVENGTSPTRPDSDNDGLDDADEINTYLTDPAAADTDGDGASDGWEVMNGYDPLTFNSTFNVNASSEEVTDANPVSASVSVELNGSQVETLNIARPNYSDNTLISSTIAGYLGSAYDFTVEGEFSSATLTFRYDTSLGTIGDDFQPRIYYFNEGEGTFEELENQSVEDGVVTAVTTHFSTYILLNKVEFDKIWEAEIKPPEYTGEDQKDGLDVVLAIDSSGSMSSNDRQGLRKEAAKNFVDKLGENDRCAVIDFDSGASLVCPLTTDKSSLLAAIDSVNSSGGTNLSNPVSTGIDELTKDENNHYKYIILLTDGNGSYSSTYSQQALDAGIVIYTIGLGNSVDTSLLTEIASFTGGKYYHATTADDLIGIYDDTASETIDYVTDSNNDGISDYYTKLIYDGTLVLSNGSTEFTGIDFNYNANGEASDDYDGDGLKNGEELQVISNGNKVYLKMFSDPMMIHSDDDQIDDYQEVQDGTDPLKFEYNKASIDFLTDDSPYYYEYYTSNAYDGNLVNQIDSAFLSAIFGVWDLSELGRDIMADYFSNYVEPFDSNVQKQERNVFVDMVDSLLGTASNISDKAGFYTQLASNLKNLVSVANGYVTNIEELSAEFIKYVEQVITYDANAGVFSISTYSMRSASVSILTSKSPLAAEKISGSTFTFDLISGALDIADTITTFATINANSAIFDENMDFLMEMRDNGNRAFTKDAAADIINALGEGYGTALASAVGADIGELTLNMAISIAASNPYVKAVVFVRDVIAQLTGIKDTLKREYEMLTYSDMSLSANRLISDASYSSGSYYYDRTGDLPRYLTNLAQIRILGEQKYEQFYTNGINSWFNDTDRIKANIEMSIGNIKSYAAALGLSLSESL